MSALHARACRPPRNPTDGRVRPRSHDRRTRPGALHHLRGRGRGPGTARRGRASSPRKTTDLPNAPPVLSPAHSWSACRSALTRRLVRIVRRLSNGSAPTAQSRALSCSGAGSVRMPRGPRQACRSSSTCARSNRVTRRFGGNRGATGVRREGACASPSLAAWRLARWGSGGPAAPCRSRPRCASQPPIGTRECRTSSGRWRGGASRSWDR